MTTIDIRIPKLGMEMTEATLAGWLVADGTAVAQDQPIYELETDKVEHGDHRAGRRGAPTDRGGRAGLPGRRRHRRAGLGAARPRAAGGASDVACAAYRRGRPCRTTSTRSCGRWPSTASGATTAASTSGPDCSPRTPAGGGRTGHRGPGGHPRVHGRWRQADGRRGMHVTSNSLVDVDGDGTATAATDYLFVRPTDGGSGHRRRRPLPRPNWSTTVAGGASVGGPSPSCRCRGGAPDG